MNVNDIRAGVNVFREDGLMLRRLQGIETVARYLALTGAIQESEEIEFVRCFNQDLSGGERVSILLRLRKA